MSNYCLNENLCQTNMALIIIAVTAWALVRDNKTFQTCEGLGMTDWFSTAVGLVKARKGKKNRQTQLENNIKLWKKGAQTLTILIEKMKIWSEEWLFVSLLVLDCAIPHIYCTIDYFSNTIWIFFCPTYWDPCFIKSKSSRQLALAFW